MAGVLAAQTAGIPNPTQQPTAAPAPGASVPVYKVTVVGRTTQAVNYRYRSGETKVDFRGTALLPEARGVAEVSSRQGFSQVQVDFQKMVPASKFGPEYMTYVLWAISPEGRAQNMGEVVIEGDRAKLDAVSTELQAFGMIVTAEPYYAVTQPSDVVVLENFVRSDTKGKFDVVDAKYELLQRGQYVLTAGPGGYRGVTPNDKKVPFHLFQARNAIEIARLTGADRYAADTYNKAVGQVSQAQAYQDRRAGAKPVTMTAREAIQTAEDARLIAIRRIDEERLAQERQASADREAAAKAQAEAADRQRREEELSLIHI